MTESAAHKAWVKAHPEARSAAQRRWREKNRDYQPQWRARHPGYKTRVSRRYRRQREIARIKAQLWAQHLLRLDGVPVHEHDGHKAYRGDSWKLD